MKRVVIIFVVGAFALVLFGLTLGRTLNWNGGDQDRQGAAITPRDLTMVSTKCGVTFPPGVRGEHFRWLGSGIDPGFYAKVQAPAASESQLLASITALPNQDISLSGNHDPLWWRPHTGTVLVERTLQDRACYVRVVLCKEQDGLMVYVAWFSV